MLVDDQPSLLSLFGRYATNAGWYAVTCTGLSDVERALDSGIEPSIVVTDMVLEDSTGVAVDELFRRRLPSVPVVFMSGYDNIGTRKGSLVLSKTCSPETFVEYVSGAMKRAARATSDSRLRTSVGSRKPED